MLNLIKKTPIFCMFIFVLIGCAVQTSSETGRDLAMNVTPNVDLDSSGNNPVTPTVEVSLPKELKIYEDNLISEYDPILDNFEKASRYTINLVIEDGFSQILGKEEVIYTNLESEPLTEVYLLLLPNSAGDYITVNDVYINELSASSEITFGNTVLKVILDKPLEPDESVAIELNFNGTIPQEMSGNYGLYSFQDNVLALDAFFPIIPVYDEQGWHVQDPPKNADLIFTDASFFNVTVEASEDLVIVASGIVGNREVTNNRQIVTFFGGPQRDFYIAASSRFIRNFKTEGETRISSYYPKEFKDAGNLALETASNAVRVFSDLYGSYPFSELNVVSTPMLALGMEYSGVAAMGINLYNPGDYIQGVSNASLLESSTAHEVAHQWFFNQVMNDQISEPWLDEGLVQYLTYQYFLQSQGEEAADQVKKNWEMRWSRAGMKETPIGKPANDYSGTEYSAIVYGRAPLFILELENKMGKDVFSNFLAEYINEYRWKTVTSENFRSMAENKCDCDLGELFNEWWAFK